MTRPIALVGAPSSAGAYAPGPDLAPDAWRRHGLAAALAATGRPVRDRGDVARFRWRPDAGRPEAMNLDAALRVGAELADRVAEALAAGEDVIVLGGDCSVELGTLAGALRDGASTGLIYLDLDVDLNPPGKGEGALGWMGVAHMLDLPGAEPALAALGPRRPLLQPSDILFLAADAITEGEAGSIAALGLEVIDLAAVRRDPAAALARAAAWAGGFERVLVHLDVDVLRFADFPIAENTRRQDGLGFDELAALVAGLLALPGWRALTIAQIDPNHAPDEAESFARLNAMLAAALMGRPSEGPAPSGESIRRT